MNADCCSAMTSPWELLAIQRDRVRHSRSQAGDRGGDRLGRVAGGQPLGRRRIAEVLARGVCIDPVVRRGGALWIDRPVQGRGSSADARRCGDGHDRIRGALRGTGSGTRDHRRERSASGVGGLGGRMPRRARRQARRSAPPSLPAAAIPRSAAPASSSATSPRRMDEPFVIAYKCSWRRFRGAGYPLRSPDRAAGLACQMR
jgi:hypothetical protein